MIFHAQLHTERSDAVCTIPVHWLGRWGEPFCSPG